MDKIDKPFFDRKGIIHTMSNSDLARILLIFQQSGRKDDVLTILPDRNSMGYNITFAQNTIGNTSTTYVKNDELASYLDRFRMVIEHDLVPYECVQIDSPTYPSVIVSMDQMRTYLPLLQTQIDMFQRSWPTEYTCCMRDTKLSRSYNGHGRLVILLQRETRVDDILTIRPDSLTEGYLVRFDQTYIRNTTETYLHADEILPYIQQFMEVLYADEEPFPFIQIDCPMYPSIVVPVTNVRAYTPLLLDMLRSLETSWPMEQSGKARHDPRREYDWDVLAY